MSKKKLIPEDEANVHPSLMAFFGYCYFKSAMFYRVSFHEDIKDLGLIAPQCGILYVLSSSGKMSQVALGSELNIDKATMVKHIDDLEKNNYVTRMVDTADRRIKLVEITSHGILVIKELNKIRKKNEEKFLSVLTDEEKEQVKIIIPKLLNGILPKK